MAGMKWFQEELKFVKNEYQKQVPIRVIAKSINRGYDSVAHKAKRIGLKHPFMISFFEPILTPSFFYVLGAWYGDRNSPNKLGIFVNDYDFAEHFAECLKDVVKKNVVIHNYNGRYFVQNIDRNFAKWVNGMSFTDILEFIFLGGKENMSAFLRGFFDAEGTVVNRYVQADQKTKDILEICMKMLASFGIKSSITFAKPHGCPEYGLRIENLTSLIRFLNNIGFSIERKQDKLKTMVQNKIKRQYTYAKKYYQMLYLEKNIVDIAKDLNVCIQTIYNWKNGKKPLLLKDGLNLEDIEIIYGDING